MSLAMKYAMKKRMAKGGSVVPPDDDRAGRSASVSGGYAKGGMVDRIMAKCYSKGGMVANDTLDHQADAQEAQFDDLVLRDYLESDYTGANSGDEIGNAALDADDRDMVSRIMHSRAKKDRLPRPA